MANVLMPLAGGALIGLSATLLLLTHGRRAGVTRIVAGAFEGPRAGHEWPWRVAFLTGMAIIGALAANVHPGAFAIDSPRPLAWLALAGLVAGFGARIGGGCTSGHGVCGLSALSPRSLVATLTFMTTGALAVYFVRHVLGVPS
jgi:uncharacterized membrane protein YedE/YeeE